MAAVLNLTQKAFHENSPGLNIFMSPLFYPYPEIDQCKALDIFSFTSLAYPISISPIMYGWLFKCEQDKPVYISSTFLQGIQSVFFIALRSQLYKCRVYQYTYNIWNNFEYSFPYSWDSKLSFALSHFNCSIIFDINLIHIKIVVSFYTDESVLMNFSLLYIIWYKSMFV